MSCGGHRARRRRFDESIPRYHRIRGVHLVRYLEQRKAKSVLCLPIVKQTKLIGVLYLENNLTPYVFTAGRVAVLEMLASQAAIPLENARLYGELAAREAKIRRLVESNILGIVIWNMDGQVVEANDAFLHLVDFRRFEPDDAALYRSRLSPKP
jgi:GAF domain-containing protein